MGGEYKELAILAEEAAMAAGDILRLGFGTSFSVRNKEGKNNLVTEYDHRAEDAILSLLSSRTPESDFLAEESGSSSSGSALRWIVDPLDGTVNFAHGLPIFSVSIAAELHGEIVAGVVYQPILREMFSASKGQGSWLNNTQIFCSSSADLNTSFLVTGFAYNISEHSSSALNHFGQLIGRGIPVRRLGSAALDMAYVACGRFDGFWEESLQAWDVAAGCILTTEAGGAVTAYSGENFRLTDNSIIAANKHIIGEIIEVVSH